MLRRAIVLTWCVALGLAPVATQAGGMAVAPNARSFEAPPAFRQTSAFGSPGGFPFMAVSDRRSVVPRFGARRLVRHAVFPAFPITSFLFAPDIPYAQSTDAPSTPVTVSPVTYVSPTVYVSVPVAAAAPAPVGAPTAPPFTPSVVEYPTGRYELRGDGASAPYAWVWIPNPPPAPPASPPGSPAAMPSSVSRSQVYRWTDEQGTEFWTNRPEKVPEPYRARAGGPAQLAAQQ